MADLEVITANMSLGNGDIEVRYRLFAEACLGLPRKPDIIALQEVALGHGQVALDGLCRRLGSAYDFRIASVYPGKEDEKGVAIVTHIPVSTSTMYDKHPGKRVQVVKLFDDDGTALVLANVHLESSPHKEGLRKRKIAGLTHFLNEEYTDIPHVLAGDWNATPIFPSVRVAKTVGFESAHEAVHGREPAFTYPTPLSAVELVDGGYSKPRQLRTLQALAIARQAIGCLPPEKRSESGLMRYAIDYIMARNGLRAVEAGLVYDDTTGRPPFSDHYGLRARLVSGLQAGPDL